MTKLDFGQMTRQELKAYIRENPTDDEAIRELFLKRRSPHTKIYPSPENMTKEELLDIFRQKNDS
ncbi:DUF6887 family protein [Nostoc sp. MS1]|uniref:DUF6887 family protein n=1 Tax=Nostoc sp. MS1 TaxID=2764711 RepID=UPI001CC785FE|nr:hypothetical protein [Nostoc sp. MS1]BCL35070.1 hypothetical protein NSMS1_15170 [Nostoc sp. MS1]